MRKKLSKLLSLLLTCSMLLSMLPTTAFASETALEPVVNAATVENVAKVGNTEYATIDEAIANWTNGSTLTLMTDVTLSDVITLKSTEHHILDLGTYTMTAASGKHAIEITCEGRSSASYALTVNADAENPGGITATGKSCIYYSKSDSTKDRPIIRIYNGVFNGTYSINSKSNGNTNCPQIWIYGGTFNGNVNLTKNMLRVFGGTFNGWINCTGDSSAYREISGGRFKSWQFMTADADNKFWVGTSKANYDVGLYVDDEGYLVVGGPVIKELSAEYPAVASNYSKWSSSLKYSSAATYGLFYTNIDMAVAKHGKAYVEIYEEPPVVVPDNIVGTIVGSNTGVSQETVTGIVNEIKANTALNEEGYAPSNIPEGAKLVIELAGMDMSDNVPAKIVYDVTPMKDGEKAETTEAITFRLPIPVSVTEDYAKVYHENELMGTYRIEGEGNGKYVEVSSANFSKYTVEPTNEAAPAYIEVTDAEGNVSYLENFQGFNTSNVTVKLLANVGDYNLNLNKATGVILELNGFTFSKQINLNNGAELTIKDSSEAKSGKVVVDKETNDTYAAVVIMRGTLTVEGGTIETTGTTGAIQASLATLNIDGGKIVSQGNGVELGTWTLTNNKFPNTVTMTGGEIKAAGKGIVDSDKCVGTKVTIEGGKIDSTGDSINVTTGEASVSGGTFSTDVSDYCAEGFESKQNADGSFGVTEAAPAYVAKIGEKGYETFMDALTAALENGASEIKVLSDVREVMPTDVEIVLKADLTITAEEPVKVQFYNNGTSYDFIVNSDKNAGEFIFTIGKNVTFQLEDRIVWLGYYGDNVDVVVEGTLAGWQIWHGADTKVTSTGTLKSTGEALVMRRGATLTVESGKVDANYFSILAGNIAAKNATITSGPIWVNNTGNNDNEGGVSIDLDSTVWTSTGNLELLSEKTAEINLSNGSSLTATGKDYGPSRIDENSTITVSAGTAFALNTLTGEGKISIDAAGMSAGDDVAVNGDFSGFAGTVKVTANDSLQAEIDENGKIVLVERTLEGSGTEADPFQINSLSDLELFRDKVNAGNNYMNQYIQLKGDIDLGDSAVATYGTESNTWTPIGTKAAPFCGIFDGNDKTISNLVVSGEANQGFFGYANTCTIKNLTINNATVTGTDCVGAIAGQVYSSSTVDNCHVTGSIKIEGQTNVGGILGKYYAKVSNSSVIGDGEATSYVKGTYVEANLEGDNIGGIMGHCGENNNLVGNTVKNITVSGTRKIGGIVGIADQQTDVSKCVVENVVIETTATADYANVNLSTMSMGGLIGQYQKAGSKNDGTVTECTVDGVTFANANNVTVSAGAIVGGARGGNGGMLAPAATISASGTTVADVSGANNNYLFVAEVGGANYTTLQDAIDAADGKTVTLLIDVTQADGILIADKNLTIDLNGKTFTVTEGASTNNRNFKINGTSVVTIKNGTMIAEGDLNSGCYGTIRTEGNPTVTLEGLKLYNYRGNGLNIKAVGGNITVTDVEIYAQYGGGIEAAGATMELTNVKVDQKGIWTAPYNSMAISVNGGGKVIVNSGTYTTEPLAAADANNQGSSHGSWAVGVLNSGGTLIINGGTFVNGNYGEDSLATAARGLILADTGANVEIYGGTFNALKGIIDYQNNLGDASKNPVVTIKGGTYSADPTNNYVEVSDGYAVEQNADGTYSVVKETGLKGSGTETDPYLINDLKELILFRDSVNAGETKYNAEGVYVALNADIDMSSEDWSVNIGDDCTFTFDGIFDGKSHTISNLTSTETAQKGDGYICTGLFGAIYGSAVVKNLTIKNVTINTSDFTGSNVGAVVGFAYSCTGSVENVLVTGDIKINAPGVAQVGAIVGYDYYGKLTVKNCSVVGNNGSYINGDAEIGGIIGYASTNSTIEVCTVENVAINGTGLVGGIAGIALSTTVVKDSTVKNVTLTTTGEYWGNSAAVAVGTIAANGTTVSNVTFENVTSNGVATDKLVGSAYIEKPTSVVPAVQARIGDVYYITLMEAVDAAAKAGDTVTLLADVELSSPLIVPTGKTITLELGEYDIKQTTAAKNAINNFGVLTINGTTGTVTGLLNAVYNAGTITINGGTFKGVNNGLYNEGNDDQLVAGVGIATINSGSFIGTSYNGVYSTTYAKLTVAGGEFTTESEDHYDICGNNWKTHFITAGNYSNVKLEGVTISGGKFELDDTSCLEAGVEISGGTFVLNDANVYGTIKGGNFSGTFGSVKDNYGSTLTLAGGNFSVATKTSLDTLGAILDTGYTYVEQGDGSFNVETLSRYKVEITSADPEKGLFGKVSYVTEGASGGSVTGAVTIKAYAGKAITISVESVTPADGYRFKGWYTNAEGTGEPLFTEGALSNATFSVTGDTTVYAVFEEIVYVAQIGDTKYATLAEAVAAIATDGSDTTIKLLRDVEVPESIEFNYGTGDIIFTADKPVTVKQTAPATDFAFVIGNDINIVIDENVTFEIYDNSSGMYVYYGPSLTVNGTVTGGQNWGVLYLWNGKHTVSETGKIGAGRVQIGFADVTVEGGEVDTNYLLVEGSSFTADGANIDANVIYDNNNGGQRYGESAFVIKNGSTVNASKITLSYAGSTLTIDSSSKITADAIVNSGKIIIDAAGFTGESVTVIDLKQSAALTGVELINGTGYELVYGDDGDVTIVEKAIEADMTTVYVNSAWASVAEGTEVETGKYIGYNAFAALTDITAETVTEETTKLVIYGGSYANTENTMSVNLLQGGIKTVEAVGGTVVIETGNLVFNTSTPGVYTITGTFQTADTETSWPTWSTDGVTRFGGADGVTFKLGNAHFTSGGPIQFIGGEAVIDEDSSITLDQTKWTQMAVYADVTCYGEITLVLNNHNGSLLNIGHNSYASNISKLTLSGEKAKLTTSMPGSTETQYDVKVNDNATLTIENGAQFTSGGYVIVETENGNSGKIVSSSPMTVGTLVNHGTVEINATAFAEGTKVIEQTNEGAASLEGKVTVTVTEGYEVTYGDDGDVTVSKVEGEGPVATTNKHSVSYQVGLIEPWFLRINFFVRTSGNVYLDPSNFKDYGAYAIRMSDLENADEVIANKDYAAILENAKMTAYTKGTEVSVFEEDNHAMFAANVEGKKGMSFRYRENIFTYEMSDPIVYFCWYVDGEGLHYTSIIKRSISDLVNERMENSQYPQDERTVYKHMSKLEKDIITHRGSATTTLPDVELHTVAESGLGTPTENTSYKFSRSRQIILVEPWGLRINGRARTASDNVTLDYSKLDDYGIIVYHAKDAGAPATAEEMLAKKDAYVFSKAHGNTFTETMTGNNMFCARYRNEIYTYELDSSICYMLYIKVDGKYYYSSVITDNIKRLAEERAVDISGEYTVTEQAVYTDMVALCEAVTAYREARGEN